MSLKKCVQCGDSYQSTCNDCIPKCTSCSNKCTTFIDTNCVFYNYNQPWLYSELTCLGISSDSNLTTILKAIDSRMCTAFLISDTYTIDLEWVNGNILRANAIIDPASTLPYSISSAGIKLDCCEDTNTCANVDYEILSALGDVTATPSFYQTLQPDCFTKSQYLSNVGVVDSTTVIGGGVVSIKYSNYLTNSVSIQTAVGASFQMSLNVCAADIVGKTSQFVTELSTTPYCKFIQPCVLEVSKVPHSEKFFNSNFYNPQFEENPIYNNKLYFLDNTDNLANSQSYIRYWDFNSNEVVTISGAPANLNHTINGATGDLVEYPYLSSLIIDQTDINNNEPAIYSVTEKCVCRIIRSNNSSCDERNNWTSYVIGGNDTVVGALTNGNGLNARFNGLNGIKILGYYNNAPIFILSDRLNSVLRIMYLNIGSKNLASSWSVATLPCDVDPVNNTVDALGYDHSTHANVNVDRTTNEIFTFYETGGNAIISVSKYTGNPNLPSDYLVGANYTTVYALEHTAAYGNTIGVNDGYNTNGKDIHFISKLLISGVATYVYGEYSGTSSSVYLNKFIKTVSNPASPSDYEFSQVVADNTGGQFGNIGDFSNTCYAGCFGLVTLPNGTIVDYGFSGFRKWDFSISEITEVLIGETDGTYSQTDINTLTFMDSQYKLIKTC